jgi:dTDP-4-amino-4,6-dideoxygalactose transaminase
LLEAAITPKTRAIVVVHYAGVGCEMDAINELAQRQGLAVIEDAAQGLMAYYKGRPLGTLGRLGCISFHETKIITCGEGGVLLLTRSEDIEQAEIIRDKGTDRTKFYRGEVDRYTWVDLGSSYVLSELNAAFLLAQLEKAEQISESRLRAWNAYQRMLRPLRDEGLLETPIVPTHCQHNGSIYYIKLKDAVQRDSLSRFLRSYDIRAVFHYVPLHASRGGRKYGRFHGEDRWTTREAERLLRLPLYYGMTEHEAEEVVGRIFQFFNKR